MIHPQTNAVDVLLVAVPQAAPIVTTATNPSTNTVRVAKGESVEVAAVVQVQATDGNGLCNFQIEGSADGSTGWKPLGLIPCADTDPAGEYWIACRNVWPSSSTPFDFLRVTASTAGGSWTWSAYFAPIAQGIQGIGS